VTVDGGERVALRGGMPVSVVRRAALPEGKRCRIVHVRSAEGRRKATVPPRTGQCFSLSLANDRHVDDQGALAGWHGYHEIWTPRFSEGRANRAKADIRFRRTPQGDAVMSIVLATFLIPGFQPAIFATLHRRCPAGARAGCTA